MAAKYWIKLYHEILHDPKMCRMPAQLWKRTVEMFLMAGEKDKGGYLPSVDDMAWTLRTEPEQLETELIELQRLGILTMIDTKWFVVKFAERQKAMTKAEYMRRKRAEEQRDEYYMKGSLPDGYQPVTDGHTDKKRKDKESETEGDVCAAYETNIGALTPMIGETIHDDVEEYSAHWCIEAIKIAVQSEKRSWKYIQGILKRWKIDGFNAQLKSGGRHYQEVY